MLRHRDTASAVEAILDMAEPLIRADERAALNGKLLHLYTQNAHAEAVAAKLVEVICRIDEEAEWYTPSSLEMARHQRDAARKSLNNAEAAALVFKAERDAALAEVERLREDVRHWEAVADGEARR